MKYEDCCVLDGWDPLVYVFKFKQHAKQKSSFDADYASLDVRKNKLLRISNIAPQFSIMTAMCV